MHKYVPSRIIIRTINVGIYGLLIVFRLAINKDLKDSEIDVEEEKKQEIEVFNKHVLKELDLQFSWSLWEHYECLNN